MFKEETPDEAGGGVIEKPEARGIKETSDVIAFVAGMISTAVMWGQRAVSVNMSELFTLLEPAVEALRGIGDVGAELLDITDEEVEVLTAKFAKQFDIPDEEAEEMVEKAFGVVTQMWELYVGFNALKHPKEEGA